MAKVFYDDPIEHLSGKIAKKFRTIYHKHNSSGKKFTSVMTASSEPATSAQLAQQTRFATIAANTRTRRHDASKMTTDMLAFKNQRRYTTFYSYLWHLEQDIYDAALAAGDA